MSQQSYLPAVDPGPTIVPSALLHSRLWSKRRKTSAPRNRAMVKNINVFQSGTYRVQTHERVVLLFVPDCESCWSLHGVESASTASDAQSETKRRIRPVVTVSASTNFSSAWTAGLSGSTALANLTLPLVSVSKSRAASAPRKVCIYGEDERERAHIHDRSRPRCRQAKRRARC